MNKKYSIVNFIIFLSFSGLFFLFFFLTQVFANNYDQANLNFRIPKFKNQLNYFFL